MGTPGGRRHDGRPAGARPALAAVGALLPLAGLWLVLERPSLDVRWEHHVSHFWLVLGAATVNVAIAVRMSEQTRRRADLRLFLVSMAFLASAGFLALHALATPGVLLAGSNAGFEYATPVGLALAAGFALASSLEVPVARSADVLRRQGTIRAVLALVVVSWGVASLTGVAPLDRPVGPTEAHGPVRAVALVATVLYAVAAVRYLRLHRRRPSPVLLAVVVAFVLLAEAMIAIGFARNWHASWWEWHGLMALAFGSVAYSASAQRRREGSASGLFNSVMQEQTISAVRAEHGEALEVLVDAVRRQDEAGDRRPVAGLAARVGSDFGLTERQIEVLERAAETLARERRQVEHLRALVAVGQEASVIRREADLVERAVALTAGAFAGDEVRVGLLHDGRVRTVPPDIDLGDRAMAALERLEDVEAPLDGSGAEVAVPLMVKGRPAGVLQARRPAGAFTDHDLFILRSLGNQLSIAVENARLYAQIEGLFRQYMSPDVAAALLADPDQASLGGAVSEVTVLMADLRGFTPFSESSSPEDVVAMLNRYFGAAVPLILEEEGTVVQFVGDALMALFNAPARQADHAARAARAALAVQRAIDEVAAGQPGWPRFRIGINTGPALVGNVGSDEFRNFTAVGDTINLAARLETSAEVGQVVIGSTTYRQIHDVATVEPLGPLTVKGKSAPVEAFVLRAVRSPA